MLSRVIDEPFRFDPEYYSKSNLMLEDLIKSTNGGAIESYNGKVDCSAFYPSITGFYSDDKSLIPFIRVNEIQNGLVVLTDDTVFLPEKVLNDNQTTISKAYPGDLVIAKGGNTLAKVGLVTNEYPVYATCRDVIILRTNDLNGINKYYLWSFLHSKYGQNLMWRSASQTGQPHITLPIITNMHVPSLSEKFQLEVENLYIASVENKKLAEEKYKKAETKLLSELGVDICKFETEVFSVRRYTDILSAERMDAEYFQPKYDKLISTILKYDPKAKTLDDVAIYLFTGEYADKYMLFDKGLCHYVRGTDIYDGIFLQFLNGFCLSVTFPQAADTFRELSTTHGNGFPACKELGSAGAEILNKSMQFMLGIVSCHDENFAVVRKNCKIIVFMPGISIQTVDELFQTDWKIRSGVRKVHHAYGIFPVNTESLLGQGNDIKFFLFWKENCVFEPGSSF